MKYGKMHWVDWVILIGAFSWFFGGVAFCIREVYLLVRAFI